MGKSTGKIVSKLKRKNNKQHSIEETAGEKKKSRLTGEHANSAGQRSLRSNSERRPTLKGKVFKENSLSWAFKNVWNKEQKKNKSQKGSNNNATVSKVSSTRVSSDNAKAGPSVIEDCVDNTQVAVESTVANVIDTVPDNSGHHGANNVVHLSQKQVEVRGLDNDGIQVQVNDSEDDFGNESEYEDSSDSSGSSEYDSDDDSFEDSQNAVFTDESHIEDQVRSNPEIQKIVKAMVREELKEEKRKEKKMGKASKINNSRNTPVMNRKNPNSLVKSPSDTTLYMPALHKTSGNNPDLVDKISEFVEGIRIEESIRQNSPTGRRTIVDQQQPTTSTANVQPPRSSKNDHDEADRITLQAEQFKANIAAPKVNEFISITESDDDFFHITCHVDSSLKEKIERGEYVDLERLLSKDRSSLANGEDRHMEIVSRDGMTYFAPVQDKGAHITGLCKWEQAFRVYAAIYSQAQPHRASEIWQYVYVINLAASSYQWDNVSHYDFTFRQMMSQRPNRSWAKTDVQGWNLATTDPLSKNNFNGNKSGSGSYSAAQGGSSSGKNWKDYCCWKYNRNKCKKSASECDWDHCCNYCGGWNHGFYNCRKRLRKTGQGHHDSAERKHSQSHQNK